jgi:thiamine-monophosphate kinase
VPALKDIGERGAVEQLKRILDRGLPIGLGHDVGVVDWGEDYLAVTTDVVSARIHVPAGATPAQIGWYLVAVNLSDIAAAGARPLGFVAALALPRDTELEVLKGIARGMDECARQFGIAVVGGDTKESGEMTLAGTALGRVPKSRILLRSGAKPGDIVVVTGDLGRAGWASRALSDPGRRAEALELLMRPYPRVEEGMFFSESGAVTSCMDISDGLGTTVYQVSQASKVSFVIDYDAIPLYRGVKDADRKTIEELALYYGGDFELLATVNPDRLTALLEKYRQAKGLEERHKLTVIGKVESKGGNRLYSKVGGTVPLENRGWEHFRSSHL